MNFFNHEVEYLPTYTYDGIEPAYKDKEIRPAVVTYDNLLGIRCQYYFAAPVEMWDKLVVGGTMSAGGVFVPGIVSDIKGSKYTVTSVGFQLSEHYGMPTDQKLMVGQKVIIFEHMEHNEGAFGTFIKYITPRLDIGSQLNVHSINIIIQNKGDMTGVVHLDPFDNTPNYDEFRPPIGTGEDKHFWVYTDFARRI